MKKALVVILAAVFVLAMTTVAYAADPADDTDTPFTFIETPANTPPGAEYNANIPTDVQPAPDAVPGSALSGASAWTYQDTSDAAPKYEGSYEAFDDLTNNLYDLDNTQRDRGPHGGYGTSTNKCEVCHAVHRAEGAYNLLRTDSPDDACNYCHIGDHRHSVVSAYWQSGGNIRPMNGHTIGAGKTIPDSSVWQWSEEKTLDSVSLNEPSSVTFKVRRYEAQKNKLMKIIGSRRVGPTYLRCQSCHQVHNASNLIWKPYDQFGYVMSNGYKLLRKQPSGGVAVEAGYILSNGQLDPAPPAGTRAESRRLFTSVSVGSTQANALRAIDSTYTGEGVVAGYINDGAVAGFGSPNTTGYSTVRNPLYAFDPLISRMPRVEEASLAYWCADCHNLNIAGKEDVESNFGGGANGETMLTDRSHVVPIIEQEVPALDGYHCYDCHNNDMPRVNNAGTYTLQGVTISFTAAERGCGNCHINPIMYRKYKQTYRSFLGVAGGNSLSDFPHAGSDAGFKLLNDVNTLYTTPPVNAAYHTPFRPGAGDGIDKVCGICHLVPTGSHALGVTK